MSGLLYGSVRLTVGLLYPAYESFKAVKNRNVKEYVKWMTYWIVYSLLSLVEEITDIFLSWIPLYYELKICILLWLISPTTRGASVLYRGLVHPTLISKEEDIDMFLANLAEQSYTISLRYARVAAQKFTRTMIETAIKGGGGLVTTLKRSVSMNDLNDSDEEIIQERHGDRRRKLLTKSWHEGDYEEDLEDTEDGGRFHPRDTKSSRGSRFSRTASTRSSSSRQTTSSETRQYGRRRQKEQKEDDFLSDPSTDTPVYSTLPRASKRGRYRSQPHDIQARKTDISRTQSSTKATPTRSSSNLQLADSRRRPLRTKNVPAKSTKDSPQDEEFSMSYSDVEEKKSCKFM